MIGILSDSHNNEVNLMEALEIFHARQIDQLIHCGDVTSPLMLESLQGFQVWLVRGNNDYDRMGFRSEARRLGNIHYCGKDADIVLEGHRIAVCHGDDESLYDTLASCGLFEWVFRGHSHQHDLDTIGKTMLLNPGSLGGRRTHSEDRTVAVVDLVERRAEFVALGAVSAVTRPGLPA